MTDDIHDALHRAAELLPDAPNRLAGVRRKRASLVRRRFTAAAVVLIVAGAGAAVALSLPGTPAKVVLPATDSTLLTASGRVVQVPGKPPRFCAPEFRDDVLRFPTPPPQWCALGVDVRGVDLATLGNRREADGAVEGYATLTGRLDGDVLVVTDQGPTPQGPGPAFVYSSYPGCPAPPGGWDQHPVTYDPPVGPMDSYYAHHRDQVAFIS
ncbi:MAG: hypothetical protein JWO22_2723, partial [Frankiales bacterium]|nr:hypothetical protein [Frankiales bacterium]